MNDEVDDLKNKVEDQYLEITALNNELYDLRIQTSNDIKDMKNTLYNTKKELEFEIKDRRVEVGQLKQEISDLEYQVNDYKQLAKTREDQLIFEQQALA